MDDRNIGTNRRPKDRVKAASVVTALIVIVAVIALTLAGIGWWIELNAAADPSGRLLDVLARTVKVLTLSDIYEETSVNVFADRLLRFARFMGVVAYVLVALRLALIDYGKALSHIWFRVWSSKHDVIVGMGPAAVEYAANHGAMFARRRAIHLADNEAPLTGRLATFARRGTLEDQIKRAVANRAARIIVDEGDDADTWQTARLINVACSGAEVLAHITDPWVRDRLSRENPAFSVTAFSYAGGVARQVMLAHPPFLLAKKIGAPAQHILILGFGDVGESLLREFVVTCVMPGPHKLMITVIDPLADARDSDFRSRHPELVKHIDLAFLKGDFRADNEELRAAIRGRTVASPICAAYVAIDLNSQPLSMALALRSIALQHELFASPIFVCAQHGAGLQSVRQGTGLVEADAERNAVRESQALHEGRLINLLVVSFGSWWDAFDGAGMFEEEFDWQAKRMHEGYEKLREKMAKEQTGGVPPPSVPWKNLPDQLRVANRRAVAHLRAKAFLARFDLDAWLDEGGIRETREVPAAAKKMMEDAAPEEMFRRLEHDRWRLDRFLDGWRLGPRNDYRKERPSLVDYEQLGESEAGKDDTVIDITRNLMSGKHPGGKRRT